jgi:hypothetical protein
LITFALAGRRYVALLVFEARTTYTKGSKYMKREAKI